MDTTLPLDRLISQILKEHHLAQAYVNDMIEMFEETGTINLEDLTDAASVLKGEMDKLGEVGQRITLLADRVGSVTVLLKELTDVD